MERLHEAIRHLETCEIVSGRIEDAHRFGTITQMKSDEDLRTHVASRAPMQGRGEDSGYERLHGSGVRDAPLFMRAW